MPFLRFCSPLSDHLPSADLGLIKLKGDDVDRIKIPHGHVDLEGACPARSMMFAFDDMKDVGDFDHLIIGDKISR